jgi:protein-tyrosine kinase
MSLIEAAVQKAKKTGQGPPGYGALETAAAPAQQPPAGRPTPATADAAAVTARMKQLLELPLATLNDEAMEKYGILLKTPDPAAQRAYRILRTRVQQRMQTQGWSTVAVTAPGEGEGKTVTAINLALALAKDVNTWVCLVDLDLQHPKVAEYFGMGFERGLSDYLTGGTDIGDVIYRIGVDRLAVIPNRVSMDHSSDELCSPRMNEFYRAVATENPRPIVVYDMPPLLVSDDVIKLAPSFDCSLLVVSEGVTSRAMLQKARDVLREMNLLGVVLNRSAESTKSSYY